MKYGESAFCIMYLIFAIASGCVILQRAKDRTGENDGVCGPGHREASNVSDDDGFLCAAVLCLERHLRGE